MLYGSETWALNKTQADRLDRADMRMIRWMCGVSMRDRHRNEDLRKRMGLTKIDEVIRIRRLRWWGHVLRKEESDWVRRCVFYEIDGSRGKGRPKISWKKLVESDMLKSGLGYEDALDRDRWRSGLWESLGQPSNQRGNQP